MTAITLPHRFSNGPLIIAAQIQADFDIIVNGFNAAVGSTVITTLPYTFTTGILYAEHVMANFNQILHQANSFSSKVIINALPFNLVGYRILDAVAFQADLDSIVGDINSYFLSIPGGMICAAGFASTDMAISANNGFLWSDKVIPFGEWQGISYNGDIFIALGGTQAIVSGNGIDWTSHALPINGNWYGVAWNGSIFCAVSEFSSNSMISTDGINWTVNPLPSSSGWYSISWNGSIFIVGDAISDSGLISPDGINWTPVTITGSVGTSGIAWNGSVFCAVANDFIGTSTDGITWTQRASFPTIPFGGGSIAWNGSVFCTVFSATNQSATSPDGITWSVLSTMPSSDEWFKIIWNGSVFCVTVDTNVTSNKAATSPDGIIWTAQTLPVSDQWGAMSAAHLQFGTY